MNREVRRIYTRKREISGRLVDRLQGTSRHGLALSLSKVYFCIFLFWPRVNHTSRTYKHCLPSTSFRNVFVPSSRPFLCKTTSFCFPTNPCALWNYSLLERGIEFIHVLSIIINSSNTNSNSEHKYSSICQMLF